MELTIKPGAVLLRDDFERALDLRKAAGERRMGEIPCWGAISSIAFHSELKPVNFGSSSMLTFFRPGATCREQLQPLAGDLGSNVLKPVTLAPGRDRLDT